MANTALFTFYCAKCVDLVSYYYYILIAVSLLLTVFCELNKCEVDFYVFCTYIHIVHICIIGDTGN